MRLFIALVAWLGFSGLVYAQPEAGRGVWIGLGGGYTAIANKDVAASPLTYRGGAVPVALALRVQTRRSDHRLTLQGASTAFNAQGLATHIETAAPNWNCLDLNYAWLRLLTAASSPLDIAAGGGVSAYGFDRSYAYLDGVSWDALATLDARARIGRAFGRQAIGLEGGVSLLGYLHRPPYFLASEDLFAYVYDNEGSVLGLGRLYGPNRFFRGELRLEYVLHLGDRLDVVTAVRAMGYRIDVPERTATVQRDLTLLLRFKV